MPIFKRSDGKLLTGLSPVRRMIPYLMPTRTESVVHHDEYLDLTRTRPWLDAWNQAHGQRATLFHLFLWACGRALHERPGLNRFVSGGNIYEHKETNISFAAKRAFRDDAPIVTVKLPFPPGETFEACVKRITSGIGEGRSGKERTVDKEVKLALLLPGFLLQLILGLLRFLDRHNLMPGAMIANDPMYASLFVANLGSVGIDDTYHHLFEYGTISLFGVLGVEGPRVFVSPEGKPEVRRGVQVRWTFDERINDGFCCAASLRRVRELVENPEGG